jgi:hypothetical protein
VLDHYIEQAPSAQTALDIFKGEFVSAMPPEHPELEAGSVRLFEDERISWLADRLELSGLKVLELGPLEAGHSYMLQKFGARRITAVESNSRAFLKCLIVKEILHLARVDLLHGNFVEYLRQHPGSFDLCVASGVLYHMRNPIELVALIAAVTDSLFVWTHYYDDEVVSRNPAVRARFSARDTVSFGDVTYPVHRYDYGAEALSSQAFCGGSSPFSHWMEREDILSLVRRFGFTEVEIAFDHADHQNGPSFAFLAQRI